MKTYYILYHPNGSLVEHLLGVEADKEPTYDEARKLAAKKEGLKPARINGVEVKDRWPYGWN